jgi:hypothetical protein
MNDTTELLNPNGSLSLVNPFTNESVVYNKEDVEFTGLILAGVAPTIAYEQVFKEKPDKKALKLFIGSGRIKLLKQHILKLNGIDMGMVIEKHNELIMNAKSEKVQMAAIESAYKQAYKKKRKETMDHLLTEDQKKKLDFLFSRETAVIDIQPNQDQSISSVALETLNDLPY